jgi:hypothetical protein
MAGRIPYRMTISCPGHTRRGFFLQSEGACSLMSDNKPTRSDSLGVAEEIRLLAQAILGAINEHFEQEDGSTMVSRSICLGATSLVVAAMLADLSVEDRDYLYRKFQQTIPMWIDTELEWLAPPPGLRLQ